MKNSELHWRDSLYTDGSPLFVKPHSPKPGDTLRIRLRSFKQSPIQRIFLRVAPDGEEILIPMTRARHDAVFTWWQAQFTLSAPHINYRFKIVAGNTESWYNAEGWTDVLPPDDGDFRLLADYHAPAWLRDRVFYQIFPDTFRDGNQATNVRDDEYEYLGDRPKARTWGERPHPYSKAHSLEFFGGDLAGIRQSVAHFRTLGVNALYLNPIFEAPSNHKYDTQDYFRIDPHFGTNLEFAELVQTLHQQGIRIMLDGVFNHSGILVEWFQEAQKNSESPYCEFYRFREHPDAYHCWLGVETLPTLNYQSAALREMIYRGDDSVLRYWLKAPYQIDGWRFDVANMLGRQDRIQVYREVWRELRQAAREVNPDVYLMGEHSFDPTELLQGDMLDGVMNYYGFATPVRHWLAQQTGRGKPLAMTAQQLDRQMRRFRSRIGWQIALNQYNFITCHDLPRLNAIGRDERQLALAAILLLTFLGVPSIYYGDEIGLRSANREVELSRQCMEWNPGRWDPECWELHRQLIRLRKRAPALQHGSLQTVLAYDNLYAYARFSERQLFLIVLNNGPALQDVWLPTQIVGLCSGQTLRDVLTGVSYQIQPEGLYLPSLDAFHGMVFGRQ